MLGEGLDAGCARSAPTGKGITKAYWVATYRSISDPEALAGYAKLAGPAIQAAERAGTRSSAPPARQKRVSVYVSFLNDIIFACSRPPYRWSSSVFNKMMKTAVEDAGFRCVRGDTPPRIGDLTQTIWSALMRAGLVVADVSIPNPNVFYEIGLTHALGKDCFILYQENVVLPADIAGSHYYPYDLDNLDAGMENLQRGIKKWASGNKVEGIRNLEGLLNE